MTDTPNNTTPVFTPAPDLTPAPEAPAFTPAPDLTPVPEAPTFTPAPDLTPDAPIPEAPAFRISTPICSPFCTTATKEVLVANDEILRIILQAMSDSQKNADGSDNENPYTNASALIMSFFGKEFIRFSNDPTYRIWHAQDRNITLQIREVGLNPKDWEILVKVWGK